MGDIGHVDDFLCQECARWSGLGATDILAGILTITEEDRRELRTWYERHASFYRLEAVSRDHQDALNVITNQPYRIQIDMPHHPFKPGQLVFGSLVPWRGDWYWSGEQKMWDSSAPVDVDGLQAIMKKRNSHILCRFWKEREAQMRQRADELHKASLVYHGTDLVVYPGGLSMAADWQKELRAAREFRPPDQIQEVVHKHGLKRGRPDMSIPPDLLERKQGVGVFLNPEEGQEIMCDFESLVEGLKRNGQDVTD